METRQSEDSDPMRLIGKETSLWMKEVAYPLL